jgi:hypothetical protein
MIWALEIYQILFISALALVFSYILTFSIRLAQRLRFGKETKLILSTFEKVLLYLSIGIIFSYII